ncbi:FAD-dependent monooxygenase [Saccharopolyspora sp. NPDC047091]|uniref:FAD-dependent monooxygenase n=1 Tax=Saccharopolyspora sp. NPDC047091 TaxID=3155924 RepID=UPI0033D7315A
MTDVQHTQVAIVGSGPAGLVLANVLQRSGIDARVYEQHSREHVENMPRAGLVEHRVVAHLRRWGLAGGLLAGATRHGWCDVVVDGEPFRLDYAALSGGDRHWIYPQQRLVQDLLAALDRTPSFQRPVLGVDLTGRRPRLRGAGFEVESDYVVGCDGARSVVARAFPDGTGGNVQRRYPYDWLTMLAHLTAPVEGIRYAIHSDGFAGMMPRAGTLGRLYLQVPADEDLARWNSARMRDALDRRLGTDDGRPGIVRIREADVLRMRSGIAGVLQHGRAFLAGDAAHVLTPSGAKGMNLAIADAADLADAFVRRYRDDDPAALDGYGERRRVQAEHTLAFSEELLQLLHLPPDAADPVAELASRRTRVRHLAGTGPEAERFAREYVGAGELTPAPRPRG